MKAKKKLALIAEIVESKASLASMDNQYPPDWVEEIQSVLDETICLECKDYPRRWGQGHYRGCSQYKEGK